MQLKSLVSLASLCLILTLPANAQSYAGTYVLADQSGATVTLVLQQGAQGLVTGSLAVDELTFRVQANIEDEDLFGAAVGDAGALYLEAYVEGNDPFVLLAEIGPGDQPDFSSASEIVMRRQSGLAVAPGQPSRPRPSPSPSGPGQTCSPQASPSSPVDQQLKLQQLSDPNGGRNRVLPV